MTDHQTPGAGQPPAWPTQYPAAPPTYPSGPPTADLGAASAPPAAPGPKTPNRRGLWIALAAMVLAVVIAIVALTLPDSNSTIVGLPDASNVPTETPTTVTVNDIAHQDVSVDGESVFMAPDPKSAQLPTITGMSFDGSEVVIDGTEPTVIVVMAHWCPHCQAEIPRIVEAYSAGRLPAGVRVVGVATANDPRRGNFPTSKWLADVKWPFAVMVDDADGSALHALGVEGFPTIIAVGGDGVIRSHASGERTLTELQGLWSSALDASSN